MTKFLLPLLVAILTSATPAKSQDLDFEETIEYIAEKAQIYIGKKKGYLIKDCSFELNQNCNFTYTVRYFVTNSKRDAKWNSFVFDLNALEEIKESASKELIELKFNSDVNISGEWTEKHEKQSFQFNCREQDVERLAKAFKHLQSLCPQDPFDE